MINIDYLDKDRKLRKQFSKKINSWNITVLEALSMLSILTSTIFAIFSIVNSSPFYVIIFSLISFTYFFCFKFIKDYYISKDNNKTNLFSILFWLSFVGYIILLNVFFYENYPGYLFGMAQILVGLVFQLSFISTFIISSTTTIIYLLISFVFNGFEIPIEELLIAITSYSFVLLGANIISGSRAGELENLSRLEKLSTQDSLTKLLNRRSTQYLIDSCLAEFAKGFLLVIDVDNFKNVNDNQGHLIGDLVLKDLSNNLFEVMPKESILGRVGGDEFVVFLPDVKRKETEEYAIKIQDEFNKLIINFIDGNVSLSIGIAEANEKDNFDTLFARADLALYDVKLAGKNGYSFFISQEVESDKPTMLIVDDTFVARRLLKSYFEDKYNILQAENGKEALKILSHHSNISIILLDMKMPIIDGSQFLEIYKKDPVFSRIPVIVISADQSYEAEALKKGAKDMIVKPFDVNIVKIRVNNVLENCKIRESLKSN